MMKTYLKRAFQLSDSGVKGLAKSIWSFFLYYVSFVPPMICVFLFADRLLNGNTGKPVVPPVVTIFFQQFGFLSAGGAVIESVFSIKGIGTYLVDSVIAADTIAVSTCIVVIAAIFVVANFMADIINRLLCPWMVREENDT